MMSLKISGKLKIPPKPRMTPESITQSSLVLLGMIATLVLIYNHYRLRWEKSRRCNSGHNRHFYRLRKAGKKSL